MCCCVVRRCSSAAMSLRLSNSIWACSRPRFSTVGARPRGPGPPAASLLVPPARAGRPRGGFLRLAAEGEGGGRAGVLDPVAGRLEVELDASALELLGELLRG